MSGEFANDASIDDDELLYVDDDGVLADDEVPYDMHDLAEGYKDGWAEVGRLTAQVERLTQRVLEAEGGAIPADNAKAYDAGLVDGKRLWEEQSKLTWQHGTPSEEGYFWVHFEGFAYETTLEYWTGERWVPSDMPSPSGHPFCGPITVPVYP